MIVYKSTAYEFNYDVQYNKITQKLEDEFVKILGRKPSDSERGAFTNSLSKMNEVLVNENLIKKDCGILVEYMLPSSSMRLDFLITGKDKFMNKNAVIVELKQWDKVDECDTERQVYTYTGGAMREVNHPAVQVSRYKRYLEDYHTAFHKGIPDTINLYACSYLHNYRVKKEDKLLDSKFDQYIEETPVFTAKDTEKIGRFIRNNVEKGDGLELIEQIENSVAKPGRKLIEHINNILDAKSEFILVDDQLIIFDRVMQIVKNSKLDGTDGHYVVLVKGGPGTGKSVVGLNLLGRILKEDVECVYIAANAAFKNGMANKIDKDRSKLLFKHPYFYNKELTQSDKLFQVAIVDEAHRISTTPPPMQKKLDNTLIEEIIKKTYLTVFFTDDNQMIRPNDIGSYSYIRDVALSYNCNLFEYELNAQFRCAGSEGYLNWLDDVLGIRQTANASGWENLDDLKFEIVDDPNVMKEQIAKYQSLGLNSRIIAGYAWPWSKKLDDNGELVNDVKIYNDDEVIFEMPWNPQDSYKTKRAPGIPRNTAEWAINPDGANQIGCIHTAQGLEFDYVGVIIGEEFRYSLENECWVADVEKCFDAKIGKNHMDDFIRLAQNTYKTLLTRGIKGVFVYAVDRDTQIYLKRRLNTVKRLEEKRFYHQKQVTLNEVFSIDSRYGHVAETTSFYGKQRILKLEHFNITNFNEEYMYCDILNENSVYDQLTEIETCKVDEIDLSLKKLLEETPQVRYYTHLSSDYKVDLGFIKFTPKAIVRRLQNKKKIVSFIFKSNSK